MSRLRFEANAVPYEVHNLIYVLLLCIFFVWAGKLCRNAFMLADLRIGRRKRKLLWFGDQAPQYGPADVEFFSKRQIEHLVRHKAHTDTPLVRLPTLKAPFAMSRTSVAVARQLDADSGRPRYVLSLAVAGVVPCDVHVLYRVNAADLHNLLLDTSPPSDRPRRALSDGTIATSWPWQNMPPPKAAEPATATRKDGQRDTMAVLRKRLNSALGQQVIEPPRTVKLAPSQDVELRALKKASDAPLLPSLVQLSQFAVDSRQSVTGQVQIDVTDACQTLFLATDVMAECVPVVIVAVPAAASISQPALQRLQLFVASAEVVVAATGTTVRWQVEQELWLARKDGAITVEDIYGLDSLQGDEPECVVCLTELKSMTMLPCKHLCVCASCGRQLDKCPVCRGPLMAHLQFRDAPPLSPPVADTLDRAALQWLKEDSDGAAWLHPAPSAAALVALQSGGAQSASED